MPQAARTTLEVTANTNEKLGYNKIQIGADIMKYLMEVTVDAKHIMENTEMGKKMKELGTE